MGSAVSAVANLDQKCGVPDAVQIDERDSEMSSLGYGKAQFKRFGVHEKCFRIWMMASRSQCHKYFG